MPNITYQLRAAYASNFTGAVINVDDTRSYDVGAALTAGSGTITTPDTDSHLIAVLDAFPALMRTGSTPTPPVPPPPPQTMRRLRLGRGSDPGETVLQAGRDTDVFNRFELTVDGALKTGDGTAAPAPLSAPSGFRGPWAASTAYKAGDLAIAPSSAPAKMRGRLVSANADFTSGASFSSSNWTLAEHAEVFTGPWQASSDYKAGDVVSYLGALYSAKVDFTSGVSFSAANWDPLGSAGSGGAVLPWAPATAYKAGQAVTFGGAVYVARADFTSGAAFRGDNWTPLPTPTPDSPKTPSLLFTKTVPTAGTSRFFLPYQPTRQMVRVQLPATAPGNVTIGFRVGKDRNAPASFPITLTPGQEYIETFNPNPMWLVAPVAADVTVEVKLRADR